MSEKINIIVLGGGFNQQKYAKYFFDDNFYSKVVDINKNNSLSRDENDFWNCSIWDYNSISDFINNSDFQAPFKIISNSSGQTYSTIAHLTEKYKLSNYSIEVAEISRSKYKFKKSFDNITYPGLKICNDSLLVPTNNVLKDNLLDLYDSEIFIKPDISRSSKCGGVVNSEGFDLDTILENCVNEFLVAERYIPNGIDYVVPVYIKDGKVNSTGKIFKELNSVGAAIKGCGFLIRNNVSELEGKIINLTKKYLNALAISNAFVSVSYRIFGNEVTPIEIHLDLGGENIFELCYNLSSEEVIKKYIYEEDIFPNYSEHNEIIAVYNNSELNLENWLVENQIDYKKNISSNNRSQLVIPLSSEHKDELFSKIKFNGNI